MSKKSNQLKSYLDSNGLSQTELANESGISLGTINKLYNDKIAVSVKMRNRIVIGLNKLTDKQFTVDDIFPRHIDEPLIGK